MPSSLSDLDGLLARRDKPIAELALRIVNLLREVRPDLTPAVKLGWGSINFRHKEAGHLCAVFPQTHNVLLVFEHGRLLDSPLLVDNGKVTRVRWIPFEPGDEIPVDDIAILLADAIALKS
jgi:hypothetical protein